MKNILIPSTLQQDTLFSVKTAIDQAAGTKCVITLVLLNEAPDTESASYFLRKTKPLTTPAQMLVLNECRGAIDNSLNCVLEIHNQFGLTAPLLKNLLEYLATTIIIIPASYKQEGKKIHSYFLELLSNSKIPMLHLTPGCELQELNKALFVERDETAVSLTELQQIINSQFTFKIVGHAAVSAHYPEEPDPGVAEAISKNNIDLLIETRKNSKMGKKKKKAVINESLGLPVLSIYEDAITA
ncbi:hypothetical protein R1T16_11580 [Flavobacterium sp. DG1-102-2]|uniref:hypothetical protein n=1 Tax=Flavobacterium sp. DG1-102-2 TaxID=3081663 RepID=UPI002949DC34|nr:hypothetical protein [Flavobacterium sp. DG1-102-2]MDV6169067.1 hypothetical protein [Flavobacterium sp. DG1-102-2]